MNFKAFALSLVFLSTAPVQAAPVGGGDAAFIPPSWSPALQKLEFSEVRKFIEELQSQAEPWRMLLKPDLDPDTEVGGEEYEAPVLLRVSVPFRSKDAALVYALNKTDRAYCAIIFLLSKSGEQFHVEDFVRRSVGYGNRSEMSEPKLLALEPKSGVHFYFKEYRGGRRWGFETLEFFTVSGGKLRQTLALQNVGAYLAPARPYREFSQDAEISVFHGQPRVTVQRIWAMGEEGEEERRKEFAIDFRWNARTGKFDGPREEVYNIKAPPEFTGDGLPKPSMGGLALRQR